MTRAPQTIDATAEARIPVPAAAAVDPAGNSIAAATDRSIAGATAGQPRLH